MSLVDDVEAAPPSERPGIKARAIRALANLDGQVFTVGQFTVTVLAPHMMGNDLELSLRIVRTSNGRDVTPAGLNPIRITNPPILVADPSGTIVRDQGTFRLDPRAALVDVLRGLVR